MSEILEIVMLICFGFSWPVSVVKNLRARTAKGTSPLFICLIMTGYVAGIGAKLLSGKTGFVLAVYLMNLAIVTINLLVYFHNRNLDKQREQA